MRIDWPSLNEALPDSPLTSASLYQCALSPQRLAAMEASVSLARTVYPLADDPWP